MQINKKQKLKVVLLLCLTVINMIMVIPNGVALSRGTTKTNETMTINQSIDSNNATLAIPEQWNRYGLQNFEDWYQANVSEYIETSVDCDIDAIDIIDYDMNLNPVQSRGLKLSEYDNAGTIMYMYPINESSMIDNNNQVNYSIVMDISETIDYVSYIQILPGCINLFNWVRIVPLVNKMYTYNGTNEQYDYITVNWSLPFILNYGYDGINNIMTARIQNIDGSNNYVMHKMMYIAGTQYANNPVRIYACNRIDNMNLTINAIDSNQVFTFKESDEMEIDLDYNYTWDRCLQMYQTNLKSFQNSNYEGFMPYMNITDETNEQYVSDVKTSAMDWSPDNYTQALPVYQTINALEIENGYFTKSEFDYWWNPIEGFGYDYTPYAERRTDITFEITQEISDYSEYLINTMFQYSVNWNMSIQFINEEYQEKYIAGLAMSETNITKWTNWNNTFDSDVETIEVGVFPDHEIAFGWGVNTIATYELMHWELGNGCYEMLDGQEALLDAIDLEGWKIYLNFQDWTNYGNATNPFILKGMETSLPLYARSALNFTSHLTTIEEKYGVYEYETKLNHDFTNPVLPSNNDYYFEYIYAMNITYSSFETADNYVDVANVSYSTISVEEEMDENEIHTYNSSQNPVGKDIQYQYMTVIGGYKLYGANETQYTITLNFKLQWVFYYEEAELGFIAKIVGWIAPLILMLIFPVAFLRISNKKYVGLMLTIGLLSGFGVMYVSEMISINYTILLCVITVVMAIILMGVKSNK